MTILELIDLGLHEEVHNLAGVAILVVDNVPGVIVYVVVEIAEVGGHVVIHAVNPTLNAAAAGGKLCAQSIKAGLRLETEGAYSVVDATEIAVKGAVERGEGIGKAVGLLVKLGNKGLLVNGAPYVGLGGAAAIIAAIAAKTAAETAAPEKDGEYNYRPKPLAEAAPAAITAAAVLSCHVAGCKIIHEFFSFQKMKLFISPRAVRSRSLKLGSAVFIKAAN